MDQIVVVALYKFVALPDYRELREPLLSECRRLEIKGTLLLAEEGINGTVAGLRPAMDGLLSYLCNIPAFADIGWKESLTDTPPFHRMRVKLKREIVTLGAGELDPRHSAGTYVPSDQWNALISDPDVTVIDTRNEYEIALGSFVGAINPETRSFREFPEFVARNLSPERHRKVAMFCTGGIRCEKSTALLRAQGFEEVYHLQGGILSYLEKVPAEQSLWRGECYVFDHRVSVDHSLRKGSYAMCHGCGDPVSEADQQSAKYQEGICCPACADRLTEEQKARFAERRKQVWLASQRGEAHIGAPQRKQRRSP